MISQPIALSAIHDAVTSMSPQPSGSPMASSSVIWSAISANDVAVSGASTPGAVASGTRSSTAATTAARSAVLVQSRLAMCTAEAFSVNVRSRPTMNSSFFDHFWYISSRPRMESSNHCSRRALRATRSAPVSSSIGCRRSRSSAGSLEKRSSAVSAPCLTSVNTSTTPSANARAGSRDGSLRVASILIDRERFGRPRMVHAASVSRSPATTRDWMTSRPPAHRPRRACSHRALEPAGAQLERRPDDLDHRRRRQCDDEEEHRQPDGHVQCRQHANPLPFVRSACHASARSGTALSSGRAIAHASRLACLHACGVAPTHVRCACWRAVPVVIGQMATTSSRLSSRRMSSTSDVTIRKARRRAASTTEASTMSALPLTPHN